jgi:hypothetical protein
MSSHAPDAVLLHFRPMWLKRSHGDDIVDLDIDLFCVRHRIIVNQQIKRKQ